MQRGAWTSEVIASFTDAFTAAEGARFGQIVFQKIADLPVPSACAVNGACLGGGMELRPRVHVRVAATPRRSSSASRKRSLESFRDSAARSGFRASSASFPLAT